MKWVIEIEALISDLLDVLGWVRTLVALAQLGFFLFFFFFAYVCMGFFLFHFLFF